MKMQQIKQKAMIMLGYLLDIVGTKKEKIFAVGFNKSGTSSLHVLFESLGLQSHHGVKWRWCDDIRLLRSYDCFSDGIPKDLPLLDQLFSGSKFILQVRELDSWVYSRLSHIEREKKNNTYQGDLTWDNTEYAIKYWIKQRNAHHLFVLSYFSSRPSDLLVVNIIRDKSAATKVCNFLGYEGEFSTPLENVNPAKEIPAKHVEMLRQCLVELAISEGELGYDMFCPSLPHGGFPIDSNRLKDV